MSRLNYFGCHLRFNFATVFLLSIGVQTYGQNSIIVAHTDSVLNEAWIDSLHEVEVKAAVPQFKVAENGALVYDASQLLAQHPVHSALELLNGISVVEKVGDGFQVVGGGLATIIINGRKTRLGTDAIKRMLDSMEPSRVRNIEVFYSAPPSYGTRGVTINFDVEKQRAEKIKANGDVYATARQRHSLGASGGGDLVLMHNKWSLNAGVWLAYDHGYKRNDLDSYHTLYNQTYDVFVRNNQRVNGFPINGFAELNIDISANQSLTFLYVGDMLSSKAKNGSKMLFNDQSFFETDTMHTHTYTHEVSADYKWKQFRAGVEYTRFDAEKEELLIDKDHDLSLVDSRSAQSGNRFRTYVQNKSKCWKGSLEYGTTFDFTLVENQYAAHEDNLSAENYSFISEQKEQFYGCFLTLNQKFTDRITLMASVEGEYKKAVYERDTLRTTLWENFLLYPMFTFSYKLRTSDYLRLYFRSDKTYPSYWQTHATTAYINSYWSTIGNKELEPYTRYSASARYYLLNKYVFGFNTAFTPKHITQQLYQSTTTLNVQSRYLNLEKYNIYTLYAVAPVKWTKFLTSTFNIQGMYTRQKGELEQVSFDRNAFYGTASVMNQWHFGKKNQWFMQLMFKYFLPTIDGLYDVSGYLDSGLYLSWTSVDHKWRFTLKGSDLLKQHDRIVKVNDEGQHYRHLYDDDAQAYSLTVSYRFNGYKEKEAKKVDMGRFGM